jgi:hypothetical protein
MPNKMVCGQWLNSGFVAAMIRTLHSFGRWGRENKASPVEANLCIASQSPAQVRTTATRVSSPIYQTLDNRIADVFSDLRGAKLFEQACCLRICDAVNGFREIILFLHPTKNAGREVEAEEVL